MLKENSKEVKQEIIQHLHQVLNMIYGIRSFCSLSPADVKTYGVCLSAVMQIQELLIKSFKEEYPDESETVGTA